MKIVNTNIDKNKKKTSNIWWIIPLLLIVLIGSGLVLADYFLTKQYENKIYPRINVAGQNISGQTKDQAKQTILDYINKIDEDGPKIIYKEQVLNPKFSQLGISFNIDETIDNAFDYGHQKNFWQKIKQIASLIKTEKDFKLNPVLEDKILADYFSFVSSTINIAPKNSTVIYTNGQFISTDSEKGVGLDQVDFNRQIRAFINDGQNNQIELKTGPLSPEINPEDTIKAKETAERYLLAAPIILTHETKEFVAEKNEVASWIEFSNKDRQLIAQISDKKMGSFIASISADLEIKKVDREVIIDTGKVLIEGSDGRGVDTEKIITDIKSAIMNNSKEKIAIKTFVIGKGEKRMAAIFVPGEYSGRYIDVNLSEQKMRLIEAENVVAEYSVSTGKWSMPTPIGVRYIEGKSQMAWSNKYQLYMPWWNSIGGGYGIHELPMWPNGYHEGESHLGSPVSHGCIRLGIGPAETVYNWAPIGTPVNIHN